MLALIRSCLFHILNLASRAHYVTRAAARTRRIVALLVLGARLVPLAFSLAVL